MEQNPTRAGWCPDPRHPEGSMGTRRSDSGVRRSVSVPIWAVGFLGLVLVPLTLAQILTLGRLGQVEATAQGASQSADTASSLSPEVNALAQTVADNEPVRVRRERGVPQGERGP